MTARMGKQRGLGDDSYCAWPLLDLAEPRRLGRDGLAPFSSVDNRRGNHSAVPGGGAWARMDDTTDGDAENGCEWMQNARWWRETRHKARPPFHPRPIGGFVGGDREQDETDTSFILLLFFYFHYSSVCCFLSVFFLLFSVCLVAPHSSHLDSSHRHQMAMRFQDT
jgi:hypothetical protein